MKTRNIYRIFYILIGIAGLLIQFGIFDGRFYLNTLVYYTVLSNIVCVVYFILRMIYDNKEEKVTGSFGRFIMSMHTKFAVTMCITLTFLVFHFMLAPTFGTGASQLSPYTISNYILHYIIPIMTLIDLLVFDLKSDKLSYSDPFRWMIIPGVYFIFILLRAPLFGNIGQTSSPYPYPFIDFTIQPVSSVLINIVVLFGIFAFLGYALLFLHHIARKIELKLND